MSLELQANTAVDVLIGPFVDSTDGNSTEDGLTISQADVKLSKNGQTLVQKNDVTQCAFDDDGYYNCELDGTDTNTEGNLVLIVHEAGALPVRHEYNVLSQAAWDSKYAAKDTGFMDVHVKTVEAGIIANASFNADVGSTAHGTNIIALAVRKILEELNLDHLAKVTTGVAADSDLEAFCVAGTLFSHFFSVGADITTFKPSTDSLEGIRNHIGDGTNLTEAGGTGDQFSALPRSEADLTHIHGTALTETAGQLAAAFKKFFDVAAPTATALSLPDAVPDAAGGLPVSAAGGLDLDTKLANTNEITAARMGALTDWINGGRLDLILDIIAADTTTDIPALIATAQADLDIITGTSGVVIDTDAVDADALKADAVDEIWAKAMSDLAQGAPSATASVLVAINYLYEAFRNKSEATATRITIYKDDEATELVRSTISDDATTFTKGKMATGV